MGILEDSKNLLSRRKTENSIGFYDSSSSGSWIFLVIILLLLFLITIAVLAELSSDHQLNWGPLNFIPNIFRSTPKVQSNLTSEEEGEKEEKEEKREEEEQELELKNKRSLSHPN